jgi:glutamate dehydrogenase
MAVRLAGETSRPTPEVARAFMAVREIFDLPGLWQRTDALDGKLDGGVQLRLYQATRDLVNEQTRWFLRQDTAITDLSGAIARYRAAGAALTASLAHVLPAARKSRLERETARLVESGVPVDLAGDVARLGVMAQAPAIADIAEAMGYPVPETARMFLDIGERLRIDDLAARGAAIATTDPYDRLAIAQALAQLAAAQAVFTREAIGAGGSEAWLAGQGKRLDAVQRRLADAAGESALTLSRLLVAAGALGDLAAGMR